MDFEFKKNTLDGNFRVEFSSGHEAVGHWLMEEIGTDAAKLTRVLQQIGAQKNINQEWHLSGLEWSLFIENNEVYVCANYLLNQDNVDLSDDLSAYEEESESWCGLEDFEQVLHSWSAFID